MTTPTTHPVRIERLARSRITQLQWLAVCGGCDWLDRFATKEEAVGAATEHQPKGEGDE